MRRICGIVRLGIGAAAGMANGVPESDLASGGSVLALFAGTLDDPQSPQ
jgi:hypothetical protein